MNDAADPSANATKGKPADAKDAPIKKESGAEAVAAASPQRNGDGRNHSHVDGKSDSEAETVVLPGKERSSSSPRHRDIKHEGNGDGKRPPAENGKDGAAGAGKPAAADQPGTNGTPSKSKKLHKDQTATSSNLSSAKSSPAPDAAGRADSEGAASKGSKSHGDGDAASKPRKRKTRGEDGDEKPQKRRHVGEANGDDSAAALSELGDRESKKAGSAGTESPPPRTRQRALSVKDTNAGNTQRRRKPPPLHVGFRDKNHEDEDASSNGSASPHGPPRFKRLVSAEASATSPAKMPPHKKLRDRNGRTYLARICDVDDIEAVRARLEERPEDLDVADYAGNSPLQIASLAGHHGIVKVLLDAGCRTDCKNVDQDTPLIDAVENGCLEVIKLLLSAGLDPRQKNAKGEGLLDLLDPEDENHDEIKKLIIKAQKAERRQSKDSHNAHLGHEGGSGRGLRGGSIHSPPPTSASRRRTARSDPTRNDLLYITANHETLLKFAGIGDATAVDHILSMNPGAADNYAVLAAARGGHETALSLLFAIGGSQIDSDPDPLPGEKSHKTLKGTPMLAAIGGGNPGVVRLILNQPGFNPTRKWEGKTYHEISKERRGTHWEDEHKMLREAYQKHRGIATHTADPPKKRPVEGSSSPAQAEQKSAQSTGSKDGLARKKPSLESRRPETHDGSPERSRQLKQKHLRVPSKTSSREQSVAVSDREATPPRKPSEKKVHRSLSEAEAQDDDAPRPRKRLISKRDLKDNLKQRRSSIASAASSIGIERAEAQGEKDQSSQRTRADDDSGKAKADGSKNRAQPNTASPDSRSQDSRRSPDDAKKVRRPRAEGDAPSKKNDHDPSSKSASKEKTILGRSQSSALAAGGSSSTKDKDSQKPPKSRSELSASRPHKSPGPSAAKSTPASPPGKQGTRDSTPSRDTSDQLQREMQAAATDAERRKRKDLPNDHDRSRKERKLNDHADPDSSSAASEPQRKDSSESKTESNEAEAERKAKAERDDAEQKAKEEKELAERRAKSKQEEADRKAKVEQEEAERKAKAEKEEAERKAKAEKEEAERKAKAEREAEEARLEKLRQEEEQARRVAERERLRREEEERQARRRREQEERDRLAMERKRQEEEQRRRATLPRAIRIVAEVGQDVARKREAVEHWLPLRCAQGRQLDPNCEEAAQMELWVSNIQVAPILGSSDLDLSQYTAWSKQPATPSERLALFKILRVRLVRSWKIEWDNFDVQTEVRLDGENRELWDRLPNIFWIRLSDLQDIVPRHPHLKDVSLKTRVMVIEGAAHPIRGDIVRGSYDIPDAPTSNPIPNGSATRRRTSGPDL